MVQMIAPTPIADANLVSSNVAESTQPAWDAGTTYSIGDIVHLVSTHREYISLQDSNTGNDPASPASTFWEDIGATNRWRAFDTRSTLQVENADSITYDIDVPANISGIGFVGCSGVSVYAAFLDGGGLPTQERTRQLVDDSDIIDWETWADWDPVFTDIAIVDDVYAYSGTTMRVTINAPGNIAKVGQIVFGTRSDLGPAGLDTTQRTLPIGTFERDAFGAVTTNYTGYFREIEYEIRLIVGDEKRVERFINNQISSAALFYTDALSDARGLTIFGTPDPLERETGARAISEARFTVKELI